ncbi:MAG: hypothetical protein CL678_12020 [Bdellovibrionaceae bacterium]|nr:hypothetical protein [Pseudobdellovibrionaceae bacterium]|tara:strand:- start:2555 stop:2767 length:213 start_codon:yes stop_codon:yes gene_type:complete
MASVSAKQDVPKAQGIPFIKSKIQGDPVDIERNASDVKGNHNNFIQLIAIIFFKIKELHKNTLLKLNQFL